MRSKPISTIFTVLMLSPILATAQAASPVEPDLSTRLNAIEKAIESQRSTLHIPGVALVIVKDDKVIYNKGFGLRDVERSLPVTPDTLFSIGSSTKAFTAATVLMSEEEKKLSLADSPKKYLPYFKLSDHLRAMKAAKREVSAPRSNSRLGQALPVATTMPLRAAISVARVLGVR